jgi:hypothetical protein
MPTQFKIKQSTNRNYFNSENTNFGFFYDTLYKENEIIHWFSIKGRIRGKETRKRTTDR